MSGAATDSSEQHGAARTPRATYRLQLGAALTLRDAAALVPYLDDLCISDLYLSPILRARPGSEHGYDVIDHREVNPELGTIDDLRRLGQALRARGMGLILDVVPNHMSIAASHNARWNDVLENGPAAASARWFDIDWRPPKRELRGKVLYPILGAPFGRVLEGGELRVAFDPVDGSFSVHYYDHRLPLAPRSLPHVLRPTLERLRAARSEDDPAVQELESVLFALACLPPRHEPDAQRRRLRQREAQVIKRRLRQLFLGGPAALATALGDALRELNGARGEPRSFDRLEALLEDQGYRLCHWRVAAEEINYRRFFDVNDLAAIRVEEPEVFAAVHELPLQMLREGLCTGLRIDHVDGLYDPRGYLLALRAACAPAEPYLVVEKILLGDEALPPSWPVQGTTGYDFAALLNGVLCEPRGARELLALYRERCVGLPGVLPRYPEVVYQCKRLILETSLASELHVLTTRLARIAARQRLARDFTFNSLEGALAEVIACLPVYRSYLTPDALPQRGDDWNRGAVLLALQEARRRNPTQSRTLYDFIGTLLLTAPADGTSGEAQSDERAYERAEDRAAVLMRFQQLSGPVMAKGVEDTALYRYFPLTALNDVGGAPDGFGVSVAELHRAAAERRERWPDTMLATTTHDTKRGEDVRARILALAELPDAFAAAQRALAQHTTPRLVDGAEAPDENDRWLLLQTLVGTWPFAPGAADEPGAELPEAALRGYKARVKRYLQKALKEAKRHTSWVQPNEEYEQAAAAYLRELLDPAGPCLAIVRGLCERATTPGLCTALSQVLLKIASPGVPDFYQGSELWDLSLVDPDNRRPVDFALRHALLGALPQVDGTPASAAAIGGLLDTISDGRLKLHVTRAALQRRRSAPQLFSRGAYLPLLPTGARAEHALCFARLDRTQAALCIAGRFFAAFAARTGGLPLGEAWEDTALPWPAPLPRGRYRDALTGEALALDQLAVGDPPRVPLAAVLTRLPLALLCYEPEAEKTP